MFNAHASTLVTSSPFLPPGGSAGPESQAAPPSEPSAYELCGVYQIREEWSFGLFERETGRRFWISTRQADSRYRIESFDTNTNELTLSIDGRGVVLALGRVNDKSLSQPMVHTAAAPRAGSTTGVNAVGQESFPSQTTSGQGMRGGRPPVQASSGYRAGITLSSPLPVPTLPHQQMPSQRNIAPAPAQTVGAQTETEPRIILPPRYSEMLPAGN